MLNSLTINKIWLWLVLSWFVCGAAGTLAGFTGLFYPVISLLLILPLVSIFLTGRLVFQKLKSLSPSEKMILGLVCLWWFLHSLQVFVPETGFDALWYHLPLAQQTVNSHRFIGSTDFYQSFNPQFSDSIFYLGFAAAGEIGAKIVAYLFGISLIISTYTLSRIFLNRPYSLVSTLLVSSFQVVSWQSSSFYIDIAKAFWELSALYFIIQEKKHAAMAALAFGASLASKLFSVLLLPLMLGLTWLLRDKKQAVLITALSILVALPYYLFAHQVSGDAFYSAFHHTEKIGEIGGAASPIEYVVQRTLQLPQAWWEMTVTREYTSPLIILLVPLVLVFRKKIKSNKPVLALTVFTCYQILIWWYVPPTSVRYALAGFVTAVILVVFLMEKITKNTQHKEVLLLGLVVVGLLALPLRLIIAHRSWQYISGLQSKEEYLQQFYDGNVDTVLKKWHLLEK